MYDTARIIGPLNAKEPGAAGLGCHKPPNFDSSDI